jgi:2-polyprenyl-3-methyl-5-hydroxy-6-metoxy-1,4-benzoquinol methylase
MLPPMRWPKQVLKSLTPPAIWRGARWLRVHAAGEQARERDASHYDSVYEQSPTYAEHYTRSEYYFLWTVVADRVERVDSQSLLDLGCGPGQLAEFLRDRGIESYHGVDFSQEALRQARARCPTYTFSHMDLRQPAALDAIQGYDSVLCFEFLEHVERDLAVLEHVRSGSHFLGSVPNFPWPSHVRHFENSDQVRARYEHVFRALDVTEFRADPEGKVFFLLEGTLS